MAVDPKEQELSEFGAVKYDSPALGWAVDAFKFDPGARGDRQDGVRELQQWLGTNGAKVAPDGLLGPQTLAALERVYASQQASQTKEEPTGETVLKAPGLSEADKEAASERLKKAFEDTQEDEPGTTPEPDDEDERPDVQGAEEAASATARPVALSDSAIEDISQDRLGFRPYVEAVAEFILAKQTRPPLAIAINARWGQGKTSFMNMLDGQLKSQARQTTMRVATTWFNPWKYSEPAQVWAAFVANITRCLSDNLTPSQSWRFRWGRYRSKWRRHADLALVLRLAVAVAFLIVVASLAVMDWSGIRTAISDEHKLLGAFYDATANAPGGFFWYIPIGLGFLLALIYVYISFTKEVGLNLLEYVEKTDFKDKIGTLSQFENEMRRLADAVPPDLKVVVFIDDLDRCKGRVLGEIIEALQLADVSRTCIFVMGMDLQIVASAIESERSELTKSTGGIAHMEHGSGYKFLEKIIQARLSLPTHGQAEMAGLVAAAMGDEGLRQEAGSTAPSTQRPTAAEAPGRDTLIQSTLESIGMGSRAEKKTPQDSPLLVDTASHYGSRHFNNPRRLKRFINGFRLQAYLANAVQPEQMEIERLARFLVLAEKWPALLHHLVQENKGADILDEPTADGTSLTMGGEIARLRESDHQRVVELLRGRDGKVPLTAEQIQSLSSWCGFFYYPGIAKKEEA